MLQVPGSQYFEISGPVELSMGGSLPGIRLAYETHGRLDASKSNAVLIHHALSPSHHVASHPGNDEKGWWEPMVGPGKAIDTERYFVICVNNLASAFGSTGPGFLNPDTGRPYGKDFPNITFADMAKSQLYLADSFGIEAFYAVIGNSMGAMISLEMALMTPARVKRLALTSSSYKAYPANVINRSIQKRIMAFDIAAYDSGEPAGGLMGFQLARELGHLTYRNPHHLNEKFNHDRKRVGKPSDIERYFEYNANKFTAGFDPYSYLCLLDAMDAFDVTRERGLDVFKTLTAKTRVISVDSDLLFTPEQQLDLFHHLEDAGCDAKLIRHHSSYGHDAFLVETDAFSTYIKDLLDSRQF